MILKCLILFFIISSCNKNQNDETQNQSEIIKEIQIVKPDIQKIIIKHFGGRSLNDSTIFTLSESFFEFDVYKKDKTTLSNKKKEFNNNQFTKLISKIDLEDFKKITNGKTFQDTDGYDTEIIIITKKDTISKINGFGNKNWDSITYFVNNFEYN